MVLARKMGLTSIIMLISITVSLASSKVTSSENWVKGISPNLGIGVGGTVSSNFYREDSAYDSLTSSYELYSTYKLGKWTLKAYVSFDKDLRNYYEEQWGRSHLKGTYSATKFGYQDMASLSVSTTIGLPLNKNLRKDRSQITKISTGPALSTDWSKLGADGVSTILAIQLGRYIHGYKTGRDGVSNSEYSLSSMFVLSYSPVDRLTLGSVFMLNEKWSYWGNRSESYAFDASISYQISSPLGATLGYSNSSKTFKPDGTTSNVDFFNTDDSVFYLSLSYNL